MFELVLNPISATPHNDRFFMTSFISNNNVITCHLGRRYCINFYYLDEYKSHICQPYPMDYERIKI